MQVDADYKLKDMKKHYIELELKGKGYKKKLDELQTALNKHMEQYVDVINFISSMHLSLYIHSIGAKSNTNTFHLSQNS